MKVSSRISLLKIHTHLEGGRRLEAIASKLEAIASTHLKIQGGRISAF